MFRLVAARERPFYDLCRQRVNYSSHVAGLVIWLISIAYLIGSIPFGLVVGLAKGIDPRKAGSGNIAATNLGRLLGAGEVFFGARLYARPAERIDSGRRRRPGSAVAKRRSHQKDYLLWLAVGFAAIFGHMFSLFLKFKGGKGVATSCGVLLGVFPYFTLPGLVAIAVWLVLFKLTRYVSVASIFGSLVFPVAYAGVAIAREWHPFNEQLPLLIFAALVALMIVYKHRGNIARLRAGTENRFGPNPGAGRVA